MASATLPSARSMESLSLVSGEHEDDTLLVHPRLAHPDIVDALAGARLRTTVALNAVSVLEKTEEQLLPSVYKYVGCSFNNATPARLAMITSGRASCQALASGVGGYLGHVYNRSWVIALGCTIWGITTFMFSFQTTVGWGMLIWAWNGVGLSFIVPNTQSLIADYFQDTDRGKAFGVLFTTGALGGMAGAMFATNAAGYDVLGIDGWRIAFRLVALIALTLAVISATMVTDPRYKRGQAVQSQSLNSHEHKQKSLGSVLHDFGKVIKIPTFLVIIAQGILGSTPWNALVFLTVYLQLIGLSDFSAGVVNSLFLAGAALGGVLGGYLGDIAAKRSPNHGRILVCQFSVFTGIPFTWIFLKALPYNGELGTVVKYCFTMFFMGLLHVWAFPACNAPIFAEIVPPHLRNLVYAFDRSFEGAIAALGAPVVGWIAEVWFNFPVEATIACDKATHKPLPSTGDSDHQKADALGNAMLVCMVVPWVLCFIIYSFLHFTYPKDRREASSYQETVPRQEEFS